MPQRMLISVAVEWIMTIWAASDAEEWSESHSHPAALRQRGAVYFHLNGFRRKEESSYGSSGFDLDRVG